MTLREYWTAARRRAKVGFVAGGGVLAILLLWVAAGTERPSKTSHKPPGASVAVARVQMQDVPLSIEALGQAQAWQSVTVHAQVSGTLLRVDFQEGRDVKAGQVLAEIDPTPYQAALLQAQGALKRDQALLAAARVDLARYKTLLDQDSISRQQVDTQAALVQQYEGLVATDKGAVDAAAVNVKRCKIVAPLSGRAGVRLVDAGNIVSSTDATGIVTINQITPIAVRFSSPQGDFQRLSDASNGFTAPLVTTAFSQETGAVLGVGALSIADNHVDSSSGTVTMKARFPNSGKHLWPGQFVNVRLTVETVDNALTVPVAAVNQGPNGAYVFVVDFNRKVSMRPVTILGTQDTIALIKAGVRQDEMVIVDGQMSVKPGMVVDIRQPAGPKKPST